MSFTV
jgi:flagellar biogenesis protein FliO